MGMTAFEIFGVLKLDKSEFDSGLQQAKDSSDKLFNMASAKVAIDAIDGVANSMIGLGQNAVGVSTSFESAFTGVRKTVDATEEEYSQLSDWIMEASTRMASSKNDIASTMEIAGQLGIRGVSSLEKFTETMIMLGDTTNLSSEEAASALARFMNITGDSAENADRIGSVIVDLGNHFATTESDITEMATRLASAGTIAGLSATDILGLSTAMSSVGIQAEAGGTAMAQTLQKITMAIETNSDSVETYASVAGMSAQEFANAWKNEPVVALQAFIAGLGDLNEADESVVMVLDELGLKGIRQSNMLQALSLSSDMMTNAVNTASEAYKNNTALVNEAEQRYGTMESRMQQTREKMSNLALEVGDRLLPYMDKLISFGGMLMDMWDGLSDGAKDAIVIGGILIAGVLKIIGTLGKFAFAINSIVTVVSTLAPFITGTLVPAITGTLLPAIAAILPTILPIIAIVAAVVAAGVLLYKNWDTIKEKAGQLKESVSEKWNNLKENTAKAWDGLKENIAKKWDDIKNSMSNAWNAMLQNPIVQVFTGYIKDTFNNIKDTISGVWDGIKETASNAWELIKNIILGPVLLLCDLITGDFDQLSADAAQIWENIKTSAEGIWNGIKDTLSAIVDGIKEQVMLKINFLKDLIATAWDTVKEKAVTTWTNLKDGVITTAENLIEGIRDKITQVPQIIKEKFTEAVDFIKELPSKALQWGKDMIQNFVDGIKSKWNELKDSASKTAGMIREVLHFSEPDKGPLADFHTYAPDMMNLFIQGIKDNQRALQDTVMNAFDFESSIKQNELMRMNDSTMTTSVSPVSGGNMNFTFNIYGAEGKTARELADIIDRRMAEKMDRSNAVWA